MDGTLVKRYLKELAQECGGVYSSVTFQRGIPIPYLDYTFTLYQKIYSTIY